MKYSLILLSAISIVFFQNCSGSNFATQIKASDVTPAPTPDPGVDADDDDDSGSDNNPDSPGGDTPPVVIEDKPTVWPPANGMLPGFTMTGDPEAAAGANWTYNFIDPVSGIEYDMKGNLFKPTGNGPFPGLVLSHGYGGTPRTNNSTLWRSWGLVVIGVQYTHAPDDMGQPTGGDGGASAANVLRARKGMEILASLGYVDMRRLAAHGHSMGAMLTAALVGSYSADFKVASHTAGGVDEKGDEKASTPISLARKIKTPYQIHHGTEDRIVPLAYDENLVAVFESNDIDFQFHIYQGVDHTKMKMEATMYERAREWYTIHGLFE